VARTTFKTVVVILGYFVWELNREPTWWGWPPDRPGRLVTGAKVILEEDAEIVVITGCGEQDGKEGVEWMKDMLYQRLAELKDFTIYPIFQKYTSLQIKEKLDKAVRLEYRYPDDVVQNTRRTMENVGNRILKGENIGKVILVSSPDHISLVIRDDLDVWGKHCPQLITDLWAIPSMTFYSARTPEDEAIAKIENLVIIEPPFYKEVGSRAQKIFSLRNNPEALAEIDVALQKYGK